MTKLEHLLVRAMEECHEVAQRISKALIFGLDQIQQDSDDRPEQNPERLDNRERIRREFVDLKAVLQMVDLTLTLCPAEEITAKKAKVERYLERSRQCGTLQDDYPAPSPVLRCKLADEPHVHTEACFDGCGQGEAAASGGGETAVACPDAARRLEDDGPPVRAAEETAGTSNPGQPLSARASETLFVNYLARHAARIAGAGNGLPLPDFVDYATAILSNLVLYKNGLRRLYRQDVDYLARQLQATYEMLQDTPFDNNTRRFMPEDVV